jgi:hypothetical protein
MKQFGLFGERKIMVCEGLKDKSISIPSNSLGR